MKIECKKENLLKGVSLVSKASSSKGSLPILSHILLETHNGRLRLSATDLEIGVTCIFGAHVEKEGKGAVPARVLAEYLPTISSGKIQIAENEGVVTFGVHAGETKVNGQHADEFPLIPSINKSGDFVIKADLLSYALSSVAFSVSKDIARPEMSGVLMKLKEGILFFAATDGHRLSEYQTPLKDISFEGDVIIPLRTAQELIRIFSKEQGEILVEVSDDQVRFSYVDPGAGTMDVSLISKVVSGQYPDYTQIIPEDFNTVIKMSKAELVNAIKGVSVFAGSETSEVYFEVKNDDSLFGIGAESSEVGKSFVDLKGSVVGEDARISFNYRYILEGLGALQSKEVSLSLSADSGPLLIKGDSDTSFLYIVMPLDVE